jgi:hypothetical protein
LLAVIDESAPAKRLRSGASCGLRLTLLGIGAMNSPRYRPAGLLVESGDSRIMIDGGPGAMARGKLDAWLVCDERCELKVAGSWPTWSRRSPRARERLTLAARVEVLHVQPGRPLELMFAFRDDIWPDAMFNVAVEGWDVRGLSLDD